MKDDYTTNSHYITHTFSLKGWENVLFELGSERVHKDGVAAWRALLYTSGRHPRQSPHRSIMGFELLCRGAPYPCQFKILIFKPYIPSTLRTHHCGQVKSALNDHMGGKSVPVSGLVTSFLHGVCLPVWRVAAGQQRPRLLAVVARFRADVFIRTDVIISGTCVLLGSTESSAKFNPSLPNFTFPLQPHQKHNITEWEELDFS